MKKIFWFKSSSSNNGNSKNFHSPPTDNKDPRGESQVSGLRRSRSLSSASASFNSGGKEENNLFSLDTIAFPKSSSNIPRQASDYLDCNRSLNPERQQFIDRFGEKAVNRRECLTQNFNSHGSSKLDYDSSANSSCSSRDPRKCESAIDHISNKVLDLYIDGEQKDKHSRSKVSSSPRKPSLSGNRSGWRPPKVHVTAPGTPTGSFTEKQVHEIGLKSPKKLAQNVVERLSQVSPCKSRTRGFEYDPPTTVEDIFEDYTEPHRVSSSMASEGAYLLGTEDDVDLELQKEARDAADRVVLLSQELESENCFRDNGYSLSALLQIIRDVKKGRKNLALEVSTQLQCRIADRASAKEALRVAKVDMSSQTLRLEKEKNELQTLLEKELDRRSNDWSFKFKKFQAEEQRLRERVRELAEQNVTLQREISFINSREGENMNRITHSEQQLKDLRTSLEEVRKENHDLQQDLLDVQEQLRSAESGKDSIRRSYKEKETENKELHKVVTRLQRTCSEQEKTISGMRQGLNVDIDKKLSSGNFDSRVDKLEMEQVRLAGVEQTLRREIESFRNEVESLRRENITLLDRLRRGGDTGGSSCFRLDQELISRVECLQNQGLLLFTQSNQLCEKLVELLKAKTGQSFETETEHGQEVKTNGLDGYLLLESDMKIQSLRAGFENLKRNLRTTSSLLHKKSDSISSHSQPQSQSQSLEGVDSEKCSPRTLEDNLESELKAEVLLTSALRDKLFSKQLEVDQLQSELATAIRGHDILRSEVQATQDAVSSISHNMKDLELQMLRKDESINRLERDLQDCSKELSIMKGILPKVSEERDLLWEQVKQYTETNMLLNAEVNQLRKKIEFLDEDMLVKEGQITILKDSLDNKSYDILSSPNSFQDFRLLQ